MTGMDLSLAVDDLRMEFKSSLEAARRMGLRAIDVGATRGAVSRGELSKSGERHLVRHLSDLGLRLTSLRGPVGGAGYADGAAGERRLDTLKGVIELASALRVPVVSTTLGRVEAGGASMQVREALVTMADLADRVGVVVAIETAGISSHDLNALLRDVNCPLLAACCDTGAMLMQGEDPHRVADTLAGRLGLTRLRDATLGSSESSGHETVMGEGALDPAALLGGLFEAGYRGPLILTRSSGDRPLADLIKAKRTFESLLPG